MRERDDEPREPPAHLAHDSHERHSEDPRERRSEQGESEHPRAIGVRRPLGRGGYRGRVRDPDPETRKHLGGREHGELGRGGAQHRSDGERRDRAEKELAKPEASRQEPDRERGDARREPGQRSQLPCSRHRDVQIARDVGEQRIEHDERRLRRGQGGQERDADDPRLGGRHRMMGTVPPSALHAAPVTYEARSEQRKTITDAISSGRASRPSGRPAPTFASTSSRSPCWSARPPAPSQASVSVGPGVTALQRMPSFA